MTPRPLWRWWLFCAVLALWWRTQWDWLADLYSWCVLPSWLGYDDSDPHFAEPGKKVPF